LSEELKLHTPRVDGLLFAALDCTSDAIVISQAGVTRQEERILFANEAFCAMSGFTKSEITDMAIGDMVRDIPELDLGETTQLTRDMRVRVELVTHSGKRLDLYWESETVNQEGKGCDARDQVEEFYRIGTFTPTSQPSKYERAVRLITEKISSYTGPDFFPALVRSLAEVLEFPTVLITRQANQDGHVKTIGLVMDGHLTMNVDFCLKDSPCERILDGEFFAIPNGLQEFYPEFELLDLYPEAQGFIGTPILDANGSVFGHIALLGPRFQLSKESETVLRIFAERAAAEFHRLDSTLALLESETRYRKLIEVAPEAILVFDLNERVFVQCNDRALALFGKNRRDLFQMGPLAISPELQEGGIASRSLLVEHWRMYKQEGHTQFEWHFWGAKNEVVPCSVHLDELPSSGENLVRCAVTDLTEKLESSARMRTTQAQLATVLSRSPSVLFNIDKERIITWATGIALRRMGLKLNQVIGRSLAQVLGSTPHIMHDVATALCGKPVNVIRTVGEGTFDFFYNPVIDKDGKAESLMVFAWDITDLKIAEKELRLSHEQLIQSQKLETLGQMAGGIVHDFNNLLTSIMGYSSIIHDGPDTPPEIKADLNEVIRASKSASHLTRKLLMFSHKEQTQLQDINLNAVIREFSRIIRRTIEENIEIDFELTEGMSYLRADPLGLEQILMNLVVNARDEMPSGGRIVIATNRRVLHQTEDWNGNLVAPGEYIYLTVSDNGPGIPEEIQSRVFEPFFTTKDSQHGTGLGLSLVDSIIKQCGANVRIESSPGKGTSIQMLFEAKDPTEQHVVVPIANCTPPVPTTVLVVEDDDQVRSMATRSLGILGYQVLFASSPSEAIEMYRSYHNDIQLVITDVIMPHMNGPNMVKELEQIEDAFKVLYMSGYTSEITLSQGIEERQVNFIRKPFQKQRLGEKVYEVLFGSPGQTWVI